MVFVTAAAEDFSGINGFGIVDLRGTENGKAEREKLGVESDG